MRCIVSIRKGAAGGYRVYNYIITPEPENAMPRIDKELSETDIRQPGSAYRVLRAEAGDGRGWQAGQPVCGALKAYQIVHLGVSREAHPFRIVRTKLEGSYFLASYEGRGRVLVDGRWKNVRTGQAFLLSPGTPQAFESVGGAWQYAWVRYREKPNQKPIGIAQSPVLAEFERNVPFLHAVEGLVGECNRGGPPAYVRQWIELVHQSVLDFARPAGMDERLWKLWNQVEASLGEEWPSARMAAACHIGEKQLERLSVRELGRTPRQHLIWLRMRKAAELLADPQAKISAAAAAVGYRNPFVFSSTFKRVMGWSPSAYPGRR